MRRGRRRAVWIIAAVVAVVAAGAGTTAVVLSKSEPALPRAEARAFLDAWQQFDASAMARYVDRPPADFTATVAGMKAGAGITSAHLGVGVVRRVGKDRAAAVYTATMDVAGLGQWQYTGSLAFVRTAGVWKISWAPSALHPALEGGLRFDRTRKWPERAPILGADGTPLAAVSDVVLVGLEPDRIKDRAQVDAVLKQQLNVDPQRTTAALNAPGVQPSYFVRVAAVRPDQFATMRPTLEPVPGIFFQRTKERVAIADGFASHVVGRVGEITAERLADLRAPYEVGDTVGLSGLELNFERQLAGTPSGSVRLVKADTGDPVRTLSEFAGTAPQPVHTTLDPKVQAAAEQAVAGVTQPVGIVALDASTGDVKAVVSRPLDEEFDRALAGQYPPGSTFKVITTAALLSAGATPDTPATCPPNIDAGGKDFTNFEGEALGTTNLRTAFAQSCNTAFIGLAKALNAQTLGSAASAFGFGSSYDIPLPAAGGTFPAPVDAAELAAASIGQGRILASPLQMATVAAAVANGTWRPPRLLTDKPAGPAAPQALDPGVAAQLQDLMGEVVRTGTGTAATAPGPAPLAGKTGTAEVGADPSVTHAWFIGFRGSLAFAIVVEKGGVGGRVAAPIAAKFLSALPASP